MEEVYFAWPTLDQKAKQVKFSRHACHELNFFLYANDKPFFNEVVKNFISNKMEKTFVDWYLLQVEQTNEYTAKILAYMDRFTFIDELNAIEVCLLVDTCLNKGNAQ